MKIFLKRVFLFLVSFILIFVIGMLLPATPKASNYYLFSKTHKDSLLQNVESPRIIFVGGSNLVFGLNSNLIKDSLQLNPINAALTATVGLVYMMDNVLPYVKQGDVIVVAPEYQQFFGKFAYGGNDLVMLLYDIDFSGVDHINKTQWLNIIKKSPDYLISKFKPNQYFNYDEKPIYGRNIFNEYGDSDFHWNLEQREFEPSNFFTASLNFSVIAKLKNFDDKIRKKGATLFITFPGYQATSFEINKEKIKILETELVKRKFRLLGTAERYKMHDSLMFETPYHLIKKGVDLRTNLLIEDISNSLLK